MPEIPTPCDADLRYLGFTERQIRILSGQPNYMRQFVYDEALNQLMGNSDDTRDEYSVNI